MAYTNKFDLFSSQVASTLLSPVTSYDEQEQWMFQVCMSTNASTNASSNDSCDISKNVSTTVSAPMTCTPSLTGFFDMNMEKFAGIPDLTLVNDKLQNIQEIKQEFGEILEIHQDFGYSQRSQVKREFDMLDIEETSRNSSVLSFTDCGRKKRERKKLTLDQKLAHNKIEKRYRVNINTKILGLLDIVPTLKGKGDKLNKSLILELTTEYILLIQAQNERLREELRQCGREQQY